MARIEVSLHGANGSRQTEVEARGGFFSRGIKTGIVKPTESVCITPDLPRQQTATAPTASVTEFAIDSKTVLEVMQSMERRYLIIDEIITIAKTVYNMRVHYTILKPVFADLEADGKVEHEVNRSGQDCYRLKPEKQSLKELLAEVDAVLKGGA